jgi:hypothetical protein
VLGVDISPVPAEQIHPYALLPESTFQQGCFPPCLCPVGVLRPISGTFALVDLAQGPLFTEFAMVNVDWLVAAFSGASGSGGIPVSGFGTYRVGGEFAAQQQLGLDLRVGEAARGRFDSGLGLGGGYFPRIDIVVSVNGGVCHDIVIDLHALPTDEMTSAIATRTRALLSGTRMWADERPTVHRFGELLVAPRGGDRADRVRRPEYNQRRSEGQLAISWDALVSLAGPICPASSFLLREPGAHRLLGDSATPFR